ncbi:MAG: hypothetical protein ACLGJC_18375 [Alphaproteobacteria bacterium]
MLKNDKLPKLIAQLWNGDPAQRLHAANMLVQYCDSNDIRPSSMNVLIGDRLDLLERQDMVIKDQETRIIELNREIEVLRHEADNKTRKKALAARTREVPLDRWLEFREKALRAMGMSIDRPPRGWKRRLSEILNVPYKDLETYGKGGIIPAAHFDRLNTIQPMEHAVLRKKRSSGRPRSRKSGPKAEVAPLFEGITVP